MLYFASFSSVLVLAFFLCHLVIYGPQCPFAMYDGHFFLFPHHVNMGFGVQEYDDNLEFESVLLSYISEIIVIARAGCVQVSTRLLSAKDVSKRPALP